jgi:hypothetical protein
LAELAWLASSRFAALITTLRDASLDALRRRFDVDFSGTGEIEDYVWFPAWLLIVKPALASRLGEARVQRDLPASRATALLGEILRREHEGDQREWVTLREELRRLHTGLFDAYMLHGKCSIDDRVRSRPWRYVRVAARDFLSDGNTNTRRDVAGSVASPCSSTCKTRGSFVPSESLEFGTACPSVGSRCFRANESIRCANPRSPCGDVNDSNVVVRGCRRTIVMCQGEGCCPDQPSPSVTRQNSVHASGPS